MYVCMYVWNMSAYVFICSVVVFVHCSVHHAMYVCMYVKPFENSSIHTTYIYTYIHTFNEGSIALVDLKLGPTQIQQAQKKMKYESCKWRLSLCLQSLNKCLYGLFPNFYQYPIVLDANEADRSQLFIVYM